MRRPSSFGAMLISVVIPLYNKAQSVRRAVGSVVAQTHRDTELIVVDDGSSDGSYDVLRPVLDEWKISCIRQSNRGVSAARNAGARASRGDYICFLDADDEWLPDHLSTIAELISANPSAALFSCKSSKIDEHGREFVLFGRNDPRAAGRLEDFFKVYGRCSNIVNSSSACVNRKHFFQCKGFPEGKPTGEDVYLWMKLALMGDVMYSPARTVRVHLAAENRSAGRKQSHLPYHIQYFLGDRKIDDVPDSARGAVLDALLRNALMNCAGAAMAGNRALAFSYVNPLRPYSRFRAALAGIIAVAPEPVLTRLRGLRWAWTGRGRGLRRDSHAVFGRKCKT